MSTTGIDLEAKLCNACLLLKEHLQTPGLDGREDWRDHHKDLCSWKDALALGCRLCASIERQLRSEQQGWLSDVYKSSEAREPFLTFSGERWSSWFDYRVSFRFSSEVHDSWIEWTKDRANLQIDLLPVHVWVVEERKKNELDLRALKGPETWSQHNLSLVNGWIHECQRHSQCSTSTREPLFPTRLLEITGRHALHDLVRLIDPSGEQLEGAYVALSYCWGGAEFQSWKLTTSNISHLRTGVPVDELPRTFRDAIEVTKALGKRYLWIDALCIMQDENGIEDWRTESVLMEAYYFNSFCTIAATVSGDVTQGLFRERNVDAFHMPVLRLRDSLGGTTPYVLLDASGWDPTEGNRAVLSRRAWVWQERLLSRRVLHFGKDQLAFECRHGLVTELHPRLDSAVGVLSVKDIDPNSTGTQKHYRHVEQCLKGYQLWGNIMSKYSTSKLTKAEDKSIALYSIGQSFARTLGDEYMFGMWRNDLTRQLLWTCLDATYPPRDFRILSPRKYNVPSWSWLAADRHLKSFQYHKTDPSAPDVNYLRHIEIEALPRPSTLLGATPALLLSCHLRPVTFELANKRVHLISKTDFITPTELVWKKRICLDGLVNGLRHNGDQMQAFCMPVRCCVRLSESLKQCPLTLEFLLASKVALPGSFARIGLMQWTSEPTPNDINVERTGNEACLPSLEYNHDTGLHRIRLI